MKYVALDIGCIECGEPSAVLGIFDKEEDAKRVCEKYKEIQREQWHGQHYFEVHVVNKLNEEVNTEYYKKYFCVCMGCGYEWESEKPVTCPMCGSGDFHINEEGNDENE